VTEIIIALSDAGLPLLLQLQCPALNDNKSDLGNGTKNTADSRKTRSYGLDLQRQHFAAVCRHGCITS